MRRKWGEPPKSVKVVPGKVQLTDLKVPDIEYKVVAQSVLKTAFTGNVTPIPTVLIFYLNPDELLVAATIIQETMENGVCSLRKKAMGIRLKLTLRTITEALYHLKKMGIVRQMGRGWNYRWAIDYSAVQHLNDLLVNEDRGIYRRLRGKCKLKNIKNINKDDLGKAYDRYVLPPNHDIEDEEEYD